MTHSFLISDPGHFKIKVLNWLRQFDTFSFLDSGGYQGARQELVVGAGSLREVRSSAADALDRLQAFNPAQPCWLFGHFGYDLITYDKPFFSDKTDAIGFEDLLFFEPEIVLQLDAHTLKITAPNPKAVFEAIKMTVTESLSAIPAAEVQMKIPREEYLEIIRQLQHHIHRGDCYEINFCQEFFAEAVVADPIHLFQQLTLISPNPFSGLYRNGDRWLVCASPERYLKKTGTTIISQPIKGTMPRQTTDSDLYAAQQRLLKSDKDRAENVMVVDLVRNDLSRICRQGSVRVEELFGIYSFPQVHQMISTVSGILKEEMTLKDIINHTFPMGSMTGAPKVNVMKLIHRYEKSKRGLFSGSIGYIKPDGDFDFNVVIRSIMYNQDTKYLSFQTGGGITVYSDALNEWEECMLKARAIREVLAF